MKDRTIAKREYYLRNRDKALAYSREYQRRNPDAVRETKRGYYLKTREARRADYLRNRSERLAYLRQYRRNNLEQLRGMHRRLAGLPAPTRPEPAVCEICERPERRARCLSVDHCHRTGAFRGWLCSTCNVALGHLSDTSAGLRAALAYVERFEAAHPGVEFNAVSWQEDEPEPVVADHPDLFAVQSAAS